MASVFVETEARSEFLQTYTYLLEQAAFSVAVAFENAFEKALQVLSKTHLAGKRIGSLNNQDVRHWLVGSYKLYYLYYPDTDIVLIVALRHQSMQIEWMDA
jgi:plasmid stabilization system protein ParE